MAVRSLAAPLTVVQVLPALEGGGVEQGTLEVAEGLVRRSHRSIVVSGGGRMASELSAQGSEHVAWSIGRKSPLTLRFVPQLRRFLAANKVDILHARSRFPAWIAYLAWRRMPRSSRPRFVTTVHGLYSVSPYSAIMTRGEQVIAVSKTVHDYVLGNYPSIEPHRIRRIYRGVDERRFPFGYRPSEDWLRGWYLQYPHLRGAFVITIPGRLTRLKGHHAFLDLFDILIDQGIAAHGVIVGGEDPRHGSYARELRRKMAEHRPSTLTFAGYRTDMREVYAASNVVLSLSNRPESFGRTVLEALSIGTPVIGYDHGGVGEILSECYPFGRVPPGDVHAVAAKLRGAVRTGFPPVASRRPFTLDRMVEETIGLYCELAGETVS